MIGADSGAYIFSMDEEEKPRVEKPVKTIRVSAATHAKFQVYKHDGRHKSADQAMETLLAESAPAKCIFHAEEVRAALEELAEIKRALLAADVALGVPAVSPIQHGDEGE